MNSLISHLDHYECQARRSQMIQHTTSNPKSVNDIWVVPFVRDYQVIGLRASTRAENMK